MVSKNAEFQAGLESFENIAKKLHKTVYRPKLFHTVMKVKNFVFPSLFC
jgi:hypothetical protein